jgi:branched-chain amino acid transport system ATP-binding protein
MLTHNDEHRHPSTGGRQPALAIENVTVGYAGTPVLHGVQLEVATGNVVALLGRNGAGKTTLLRAAAGLARVSSGRVRLAGADVTREQPYQRARAGLCLVPERRGIFPNLTVRDNLRLQLPSSSPGDGIEHALAAFPILGDRLRQTAGSLSGGERQMLALSRAFV